MSGFDPSADKEEIGNDGTTPDQIGTGCVRAVAGTREWESRRRSVNKTTRVYQSRGQPEVPPALRLLLLELKIQLACISASLCHIRMS